MNFRLKILSWQVIFWNVMLFSHWMLRIYQRVTICSYYADWPKMQTKHRGVSQPNQATICLTFQLWPWLNPFLLAVALCTQVNHFTFDTFNFKLSCSIELSASFMAVMLNENSKLKSDDSIIWWLEVCGAKTPFFLGCAVHSLQLNPIPVELIKFRPKAMLQVKGDIYQFDTHLTIIVLRKNSLNDFFCGHKQTN